MTTVSNGGGYQTGDVLTVLGGADASGPAPAGGSVANPTKITITAANGVVTGVTNTAPGTYTTQPTNPVSVASGPGSGTNGVGAQFVFGTPSGLTSVTMGSGTTGTGYDIGDILTIPTGGGVTTSPTFTVTGLTALVASPPRASRRLAVFRLSDE